MSYSILRQSIPEKYWDKINARKLAFLKGWEYRCMDCGVEQNLTIDHRLPRSTHPKAAGLLANYKILCAPCNEGRGNGGLTTNGAFAKLLL